MSRDPPPLLRAVDDYLGMGPPGGPLRLHVPGHKGGAGAPPQLLSRWGPAIFGDDLTEVPGLDDLSAPGGAIADSQVRAAGRLGATDAHYLVQGSSGGIIALLIAAVQALGIRAVVLPRVAHRALVSAAVLTGVRPVFLPVRFVRGVPCGPDLDLVDSILSRAGPGAAFFDIYPSICGAAHDLGSVAALARSHGAPLFVDGAHAGLCGMHPALPPSPLACGAAAVVLSAHKSMGSLGQSSLLLLGDGAPPNLKPALGAALRLTQTTSPSYPLLISLEAAVEHVTGPEGKRQLDEAVLAAGAFRHELRSMNLSTLEEALPEGVAHDPLRIVIDGWEVGESGFGVASRLRQGGAVQVEGADWRNVLAVFGLGDGRETAERLTGAVRTLLFDLGRPGAGTPAPRTPAGVLCRLTRLQKLYEGFAAGPWDARLDPRTAWFAQGRLISLGSACGGIAGEPLAPYPPGVPVVWPGEAITAAHIEFLQATLELGGSVHGLHPAGPPDRAGWRVRVVSEGGAQAVRHVGGL